MTDCHVHLQYKDYAEDLLAVLARARAAGVRRFIAIGTEMASTRAGIKLAEAEPDVLATVGVRATLHPTEAQFAKLSEMAKNPKVVAIGEVGFDVYQTDVAQAARSLERQKATLRGWRKMAEAVGKPLILHLRAPALDVYRLALSELVGVKVKVVSHCFSGDAGQAANLLKAGWYLSFAGNLTYKKNDRLVEAAGLAFGEGQLLLETDGPYLPPEGHRGERNEPAYIMKTAGYLADRLGVPLGEIEAAVDTAAAKVFGV